MLKAVFARFWAIWGLTVFVTSLLLAYPFFLLIGRISEPSRSQKAYIVFRIWMRIVLPLLGIRIRTSGREHFEKGHNYVVVCNHRSFMDIPVTTTRIPGPNKTIAKVEMSRIPIFGAIYRIGSVLVDRKDSKSRADSYQQMKMVLASGLHMLIYPEGTRNNSMLPLTKFHSGAFKLAVETQTPVIPATLIGTDNILPNKQFLYLLPGTINFDIMPAIAPGNDADSLRNKIFEKMQEKLTAEIIPYQSP